jgi:hypothetical protein
MEMIHFGEVDLDPVEIGIQGNAILGVRSTGKSFAAMKLAEEMMDAGIPIIVFDPIGVWRFLRVPGPGGRGYPVVVAGGVAGDLPLTEQNVGPLIEAAMASGVSLVLDLFDINLSKADWRRIVCAALRTLLHKNSAHGLRHVFLEEGSEWCPQRPGVEYAAVYSEVEKLARMGGNSRLGFTIINQRSEEVAKAVLELCDNLFLFGQKGRNSLNALSKWLALGDVSTAKEIIASLSTLPTGTCWAWPHGSAAPTYVHVPQKNSLHPDRRVMRGDGDAPVLASPVDVGAFVAAMKALLGSGQTKPAKAAPAVAVDTKAIESAAYDRGYADGRADERAFVLAKLKIMQAQVEAGERPKPTEGDVLKAIGPAPRRAPPVDIIARDAPGAAERPEPSDGSGPALSKPQAHLLATLAATSALYRGNAIDKNLLAFMAEVSPNSSGFANNLGAMRRMGLIDYPIPGTVKATDAGLAAAPVANLPQTNDQVQRAVLNRLSKPQQRILEVVLEAHPDGISRATLADHAQFSVMSSGYANNLGALRSLGLIDYPTPGMVSTTDLLFPYGKDAR